jgi:hypothetical protein
MIDPAIVAGWLAWFVAPLWVLAGLADWLCHRATGIAHTAGPRESLLHLLLLAEMAIPVLAVLFFDVNALVIAVMLVALVAHQLTTLWDLRYAASKRNVPPIEQQVHSYLELLPLTGAILLVIAHWPQFLALFGLGSEPARFGLEVRDPPLPLAYVATLLGAVLLLDVLPYVQELVSGLAAARSRDAAHPSAARSRTAE